MSPMREARIRQAKAKREQAVERGRRRVTPRPKSARSAE
jgi:hypothetical protein